MRLATLSPSRRSEIGNRWSGEPCKLNGQPAKIIGRFNEFLRVATLDPAGPAVEWSWETIDRVMSTTREFSTE